MVRESSDLWHPRVLVIPASYLAHERTVGGGERYALEYARSLAQLTPTTLGLIDPSPSRELDGALEIRTFGVRSRKNRWTAPLTLESWRALGEFEVLHLMIFPTPLTDTLILAAQLRRQKVVLTDVGGGGPCLSTYLKRLHPAADIHRLADGLAPLSRHAARFFENWPQPQTVLYGGATLSEVGRSDAAPQGYALFVGRLLPHKGVLHLIQALSSDTPLHVVGRPYNEEYLALLRAAALGKRVTFILDADDERLNQEYAGASVVLQPSLPVAAGELDTSELLGLVTLEAMAAGKPVIVTKTGSLPELVIHGETGFVVPPFDGAALRASVERLVHDPILSLALGAQARSHVARHFTWKTVAQRGLEHYRTLHSST